MECDFGCAFTAGAVSCWGCNDSGQLGDGLPASSFVPTPVAGFPPVLPLEFSILQPGSITVGFAHACGAVAFDSGISIPPDLGEVFCWGSNSHGQLGMMPGGSSNVPVQAIAFPDAAGVRVAAGGWHNCAVVLAPNATSGGVTCWGRGTEGELGNGAMDNSPTGVGVSGVTTAVEVAAGAVSTCARVEDGHVTCWGGNFFGELGDGSSDARPTSGLVAGITNAVQISMGWGHACARLATGAIQCWGANSAGQLGDGTTVARSTPVSVAMINDAIDVNAGLDQTCAVRQDHSVWCWGNNSSGQLGDGTTMQRTVPVRVSVLTP
jgi:alpha-tubulin suppressor-like RCC1 family protein